MADDVADDLGREAEVEQERRAGAAEVVEAHLAEVAASWIASGGPFGLLMYIILYTDGMKVMTMSESRANYAATLDSVIDDQEEVLITRPGGEGVVMVSQHEYESMRETLYLMASPVNRRRLSEAVARLEAGGGTVRELADEDTSS
ncbi:hypothetical protein GCM10012278_65670 [Nonomuraea glycinis]|uniref:Antitoxin n=2 Tax=Nonomuraea glycinis TaxID=2047744 RepID=A0A918ADN0_9ACTN|nr:hypothetical protein GCM10012278_65670 [Nonomuraea glycinis]